MVLDIVADIFVPSPNSCGVIMCTVRKGQQCANGTIASIALQ